MKVFLIILLLFLSVCSGYSAAGSEFLLLDTSSRASSLGGAYTGSISGLDGMHYNPASLSTVKNLSISFKNLSLLDDTSFKYLSIAKSIYDFPAAISAGLLSMDDIAIYDISENYTKDLRYYDFFTSIGVGKKFKYLNTGVNIKYIHRRIGEYSAKGIAFDFGVLSAFDIKYPSFFYNNNKHNFSIGIAVRNFGTKIKFDQKKDSLPTEAVVGIQTDLVKNKIITTGVFCDAGKVLDDDMTLKCGIEAGYKNFLFLRTGKSFIYSDTFTTGFSFHVPFGEKVSTYFSYSIIMDDNGVQHDIGGIIGF